MTREQLAHAINHRRMMRGKEPLRMAHILRAARIALGPERIRIEHSLRSIVGGRRQWDPDLPYYTLTPLGLATASRLGEDMRFQGVLPW